MQIYEITKPHLTEGIVGDTLKSAAAGLIGQGPEARATQAAKSLAAQGFGPGGTALPSAKWEDKLARVMQDPAVAQYVATTAAGWANFWKQNQSKLPKQTAQATVTPTATASTVDKSTTTASQARPTYGKPGEPTVSFAGQRGQKPLDPNNPSDKKILDQLRQQGKLQEAVADPYGDAFVDWTDQVLASRDPVTGYPISMNDVRKLPGLGEKLDAALDAVIQTQGTNQSNAAISQYLKLAVAGIQAKSQEYKNKAPQQRTGALGSATQSAPTVKNNLVQAGINPAQLQVVGSKSQNKKARTTGNPEADALLQIGGFEL